MITMQTNKMGMECINLILGKQLKQFIDGSNI